MALATPTEHGLHMVLVDTGHSTRRVGRRIASGCSSAKRLPSGWVSPLLREVQDAATLDQIAEPLIRARARHVVTENARVQVGQRPAARRTRARDRAASHRVARSLRDDFEVSTPELESIVESALHEGALGARVTGAGFGGAPSCWSMPTTPPMS